MKLSMPSRVGWACKAACMQVTSSSSSCSLRETLYEEDFPSFGLSEKKVFKRNWRVSFWEEEHKTADSTSPEVVSDNNVVFRVSSCYIRQEWRFLRKPTSFHTKSQLLLVADDTTALMPTNQRKEPRNFVAISSIPRLQISETYFLFRPRLDRDSLNCNSWLLSVSTSGKPITFNTVSKTLHFLHYLCLVDIVCMISKNGPVCRCLKREMNCSSLYVMKFLRQTEL